MKKNNFLFLLYIAVFSAVIIIAGVSLLLHGKYGASAPPPLDGEPSLGGECVTRISNDYGEIRLTDTVGYAFEFELILYKSYHDWGFEVPLYGEKENRLIIASTSPDAEHRPKIFVNGSEVDEIPTARGRYNIRLDVSHITDRGFSAGNRLEVLGFGKIDLLCMY